tara:strand:- start:16 stop:2334 length:2319 start_codon:yes stop_codon:yes gene_type:complete
MSLQQLQQEIQRMSDTPQEYENMIAAMQKMNEFAKQTNVKEMQEGGMLQTQEQEGVGAYVPPPKQTFDMTPEKKPVEMQQGGMLGGLASGIVQGVAQTANPIENRKNDFSSFIKNERLLNDPEYQKQLDKRNRELENKMASDPRFANMGSRGRGDTTYTTRQIPTPVTLPTPTTNQGTRYKDVTKPVLDTSPTIKDAKGNDINNPNFGMPVKDAQGNVVTQTVAPNIGDISAQMIEDPRLPTGAAATPVGVMTNQNQLISSGQGQVSGQVAIPTAQASTATVDPIQAQPANIQQQTATSIGGVTDVADQTKAQELDDLTRQVNAQTLDKSSVSDLKAAQGSGITMNNPVQRKIQAGELIDGVANAQTASAYTEQVQAATALPSEKATVQGQLAQLTQNFDATNPPAWAAGALRGVQAAMAQRGLGASSMAGQAMIQAAIESALPIAQMDAKTQAQFEGQNLSNRQQRAMLAAQQRATFIGQEFDQAFQARVQNASKIADIANMNFTSEQQIALENSRIANTMELSNLSNKQAMVMAEASALANMDMANLNNRQQSQVQNAQNFLQMDMANLSNRQQTELFKSQQKIQSLFTDTAAENARRQFNATSENQVDQFFANLSSQTNQYNATQLNTQSQFNAGQANVVERFNAELNNQRDQFNASNQLVIAQSNAQWRRQVATADTTAINRANELNAQNLLGISNQAYNNLWQYYGDTMEWAWKSAENERERVKDLTAAQINASAATDAAKIKGDYESSSSIGGVVLPILFKKFLGM